MVKTLAMEGLLYCEPEMIGKLSWFPPESLAVEIIADATVRRGQLRKRHWLLLGKCVVARFASSDETDARQTDVHGAQRRS
jgi:hypothetical protein